MAIKNIIKDQTVFDACLWCYGTITKINDFLLENDFSPGEDIVQGQEIIFDETQGNESIKSQYIKDDIIPKGLSEYPTSVTIPSGPVTAPILSPIENNKSSRFIIHNQTVFDACLWCYGTITKINDFLLENNLRIDQDIAQGQEVVFEETQGNKRIKNLYTKNDIIPGGVIYSKPIINFELLNGENFELLNGENFELIR